MTDVPGRHGDDRDVVTDLVQYLMVVVPDVESLDGVASALAALVESNAIRILDLVVVARDVDGAVQVLELEDVPSLTGLAEVEGEIGGMLSAHDIELISLSLRPGAAGIVVVTEDRWAVALSDSAHRVGGVIIAGEHIPPARVQAALAGRPDDDRPPA
jgi:hypothetical protein